VSEPTGLEPAPFGLASQPSDWAELQLSNNCYFTF
jgi:hypothetical protein